MLRELITLVFLLPVCLAIAQSEGPPSNKKERADAYLQRIRQEYLFGVYIPSDVPDAMDQLDKLTEKSDREAMLKLSDFEAANRLRFGLGRWMIYNWGLEGGSRLSFHLEQKYGLTFPDDLAYVLIVAYHRHASGADMELQKLAEMIREKRAAKRMEEIEAGKKRYQAYRDSIKSGS